MTEAPRVSIIISTFNRRVEILKRLFDSIRKQDFKNYEILLVDQSTDNQIRDANKHLCAEHKVYYADICDRQPSLTVSRNFGIENTSGDIIIFLDDDTELIRNDYLDKVLEAFGICPDAIGISGLNYPPPNTGRLNKFLLFLKRFFLHLMFAFNPFNTQEITGYFHNVDFYRVPKDITEVDWLYGSNMAYKRNLFEKIHFDENLKRYSLREDVDFSFRAKKFGEIYVTPFARVHHFEEKTGRINFKKRTLMELSYWTYLYYKNIKKPSDFVAKLNSFLIFLRYLRKAICSLSKENTDAVVYAKHIFTENFDKIKKLNLSSVNEEI